MEFDKLFEQRSLVASKLKDYIRDKGFTKVSFSERTNISRPTLDKLLDGQITNKSSFCRHLKKILDTFNITKEDLIFYHSTPPRSTPQTVFSQNAPTGHEMSDRAKKQYDLLLDIVDLCSIYY